MKNQKRLLAIVCMVLIFAYACVSPLSHRHESYDTQCVPCAVMQALQGLQLSLALCAVTVWFSTHAKLLHLLHHQPQRCAPTPVALKVKLSD